MTIAYSGSNITFPDNSVQATAPKVGMVNRVINGGMTIDQRNAGAAVTQGTSVIYTADRWWIYGAAASKFTLQQQTSVVPAGYTHALKATSSSAYTVASTDEFDIAQYIEGFNVADLGWGTASAATVTLSFRVYSSLTGTFGGQIANSNSSRSYPFSYAISAANTWETKTITIAGDTSGTWLTTNGAGMLVLFSLGAGSTKSGTANAWQAGNYTQPTGSVSVVGTSGATFYITGVQLEKGSTATSFDYRPYGTELQLCQRYYEVLMTGWACYIVSGQVAGPAVPFAVTKRATPTMAQVSSLNASGFGSGVASYFVTGTYGVALYHTATITGNCSWVDQTSASAEL